MKNRVVAAAEIPVPAHSSKVEIKNMHGGNLLEAAKIVAKTAFVVWRNSQKARDTRTSVSRKIPDRCRVYTRGSVCELITRSFSPQLEHTASVRPELFY